MVSLTDIKNNVSNKPHCRRIQAPNVYINKKKGYEQDPLQGFLFPVKFIEEKYGESSRIPKDTSDSESSSDSSDDESSGSRGKPQATDESESAEEVRAESLRKDLDENEDTDDYWVVNDDRVVRVRVTPIYHLFGPELTSSSYSS